MAQRPDLYEPRKLGVVRPKFDRAEMMEVREFGGKRFAWLRVKVCNLDNKDSLIQIMDSRPETLAAMMAAEPVCLAYNKLKGAAKIAKKKEWLAAVRAVREALNSGFARCTVQKAPRAAGTRFGLNIQLVPVRNDSVTDGAPIATIIHTEHGWSRDPWTTDYMTTHTVYRNHGKQVEAFQAHFVCDPEPVEIWQNVRGNVIHFLIDQDDVHITPYVEKVPAVKEPAIVEVTSDDAEPAYIAAAAAAESSLKRFTCGSCSQDVMIDLAEMTVAEATCPHCQQPVGSRPIAEIDLDLSERELEALGNLGVNTVEKLVNTDPDVLKSSGFATLRRARAVQKEAGQSLTLVA